MQLAPGVAPAAGQRIADGRKLGLAEESLRAPVPDCARRPCMGCLVHDCATAPPSPSIGFNERENIFDPTARTRLARTGLPRSVIWLVQVSNVAVMDFRPGAIQDGAEFRSRSSANRSSGNSRLSWAGVLSDSARPGPRPLALRAALAFRSLGPHHDQSAGAAPWLPGELLRRTTPGSFRS